MLEPSIPVPVDYSISSHPFARILNHTASMANIRKIISTKKCPKALAPYNQAVVAEHTVYCSGVLGLELESLQLVEGGAASQTAKALEHLATLLEVSGSSIANVVKTTVLLADMNDYVAVNDEYKKVFSSNFPARTCFAVNKLPLGAAVEIEAIAMTGDVIHVSM
ncbi:rutC family protein UK114-like [Topomyia yanbarensis]|uniref:rutC family protein UK114-like n=1 Tax=Topomyia yanbarensis TaxID=2498891 RepID=UPI00273B02CE|nr:rutC family protein UK114-like [Topomyia yanbarensis]